MTRTVVLGRPAGWQQEIHDLVHAAQAAGRDAARAGATARIRGRRRPATVIADAGYGDRFLHGLGHGVGLEIHEAPAVAAPAAGIMSEAMVLTVEPGVYLPGAAGSGSRTAA